MPYIVTNSDGSLTVTVPDSAVDTSTYSLALVGRSVSNYGQYFAQNTIRQLENFASAVAPSPGSTLEGQLWYNKTEQQLSVWQGSSWKRVGTVVGADNEKPTTYRTSGTTFFNTTTNKLELWNDGWREAGYGGLVTSAYSTDTSIQSPTTYGTKLRSLFLREAVTNNMIPVIALVYVKSPQTSPTDPSTNRGTTEVPAGSNNYETIMALWSDFEFDVNSAGTNTPVENNIVNYYPELVPGTGDGILDSRTGRTAGKVLKGQNNRGEYESSSTGVFSTLFVTSSLGGAGDRIPNGYFTALDISTSLTVDALTVNNNAGVGGDLTVTGNVDTTAGAVNAADLVVTNLALVQDLTVLGTATGTFADLAEMYTADAVYEPGTVLMIGGSAEVTKCRDDLCTNVLGVVSTDPAYLMNGSTDGAAIALQGRVPVKVQGIVAKGDRIVSAGDGVARGLNIGAYDPRMVIGRALSEKTTQEVELLECIIGVK